MRWPAARRRGYAASFAQHYRASLKAVARLFSRSPTGNAGDIMTSTTSLGWVLVQQPTHWEEGVRRSPFGPIERCSGHWWVPDSGDRQVAGNLAINDSGTATLDTFDTLLVDEAAFPPLGHQRFPVIYGDTDRGPVSIAYCRQLGGSIGPGIRPTESFWSPLTFLGCHIAAPDAQCIERAHIRLPQLVTWADLESTASGAQFSGDGGGFAISGTWVQPPDVTAQLSFGSLTIHRPLTPDLGNGDFQIGHAVSASIEPSKPISIHTLRNEWIRPIAYLSALFAAQTGPVTGLHIDVGGGEKVCRPVEVVYSGLKRSLPIDEEADYRRPLLSLDRLASSSEGFSGIVATWMNLFPKIEPLLDLLFEIVYNQDIQNETAFLAASQASEVLHRRTKGNSVLLKEQHRQRITEILGVCPLEHVAWLKRKLEHSNEPSFYERLEELIASSPSGVQSLCTPREPFIRKVVDSRNYRVHFTPRLERRAATGAQLEWLTDALVLLLEAHLLLALGLPHDLVNDVTEKSDRRASLLRNVHLEPSRND